MWTLIIIAFSISNPNNIPATITLDMPNAHVCEQVLESMRYNIKYSSYRIEGKCQKQY